MLNNIIYIFERMIGYIDKNDVIEDIQVNSLLISEKGYKFTVIPQRVNSDSIIQVQVYKHRDNVTLVTSCKVLEILDKETIKSHYKEFYSSKTMTIYVNDKGKLHRKNGPAVIKKIFDPLIKRDDHLLDDTAVIGFRQEFWLNGRRQRLKGKPLIVTEYGQSL